MELYGFCARYGTRLMLFYCGLIYVRLRCMKGYTNSPPFPCLSDGRVVATLGRKRGERDLKLRLYAHIVVFFRFRRRRLSTLLRLKASPVEKDGAGTLLGSTWAAGGGA